MTNGCKRVFRECFELFEKYNGLRSAKPEDWIPFGEGVEEIAGRHTDDSLEHQLAMKMAFAMLDAVSTECEIEGLFGNGNYQKYCPLCGREKKA